jgi:trans-aconitate methyltransferase
VSDLGMPVVELLNPQPAERILDLGCGDGAPTKKLENMGCEPVGIDSSPELIQKLAKRSAKHRPISLFVDQ